MFKKPGDTHSSSLPGKRRQLDLWDFLTSQPSLLANFQTNDRLCLCENGWWCLRSTNPGFCPASTCTRVPVYYTHMCYYMWNWTHTQNSLPSLWWTVQGQSFCLVNGVCTSLIRRGYVEAGEMAQKLRHFAVFADVGLFPSTIADGLQQSIAPTLGIYCPLLASQSTWMYIRVHR